MKQKAKLEAETANEPIKKFGGEKKHKAIERQKRKIHRAKLGAYIEKTLGSDTTPENFFRKAKSWVKRQEILHRQIQREIDRQFFPPPPMEMKEWGVPERKNPLAKYAFDDGAMY